jgi:hypothetical protein
MSQLGEAQWQPPTDPGRLLDIARLRVLVGYLGERDQQGWWPSAFLSPSSQAFLRPVFPRTGALAAYRGVVEAARRAHDERLGVGRALHLFRLPEALEQAVGDSVRSAVPEPGWDKDLQSVDSALGRLQAMGTEPATGVEGPVRIGTAAELAGFGWLARTAACYCAGFADGVAVYPYFRDPA